MSRSGYSDDCYGPALNMWRGAVNRALNGRRGQAFLREMAEALDAMPVKELVADEVVRDSEHVCAMGAVCVARKLNVSELDINDRDAVGDLLGIAPAMAAEIAWENDEHGPWRGETPAERWTRMRAWVSENLQPVNE